MFFSSISSNTFFYCLSFKFSKNKCLSCRKKRNFVCKKLCQERILTSKKDFALMFSLLKEQSTWILHEVVFLCTNGSKKNFFLEHRNSLSFFFSNQSFGIISFKMGLKRFSLWTFFSKNWNARGLSKIKNNSWQKVRLSEAPYPRPAPANQPYLGNLIDPRKLFWKVFVFFRFAKKKQNILWDNFYKEFFFINL